MTCGYISHCIIASLAAVRLEPDTPVFDFEHFNYVAILCSLAFNQDMLKIGFFILGLSSMLPFKRIAK